MKKTKKKFIAIFAGCMFAVMMMLNVSTTINGANFSVDGYMALVSGSTNCHDGGCSVVCGPSGYEACTYMDCGSGTQLCHRQ
ncbi:hypothetical protein [Rhodohalobacter sp.]|uniref:hypothetical protein n=1 Tax=Rhodohalobacter sp. TaxID=1974210 RepID=UPI00356A41F9